VKHGIKRRAGSLTTSKQQYGKKKQQGLALLVLVIVIFLAMSTYYFSSVSMVEVKADKIEKTQAALKRAKQALLAYAMTRGYSAGEAGKIGKLPCPDYKSNGVAGEQDGNCGSAYTNAVGYFPWRTVGIKIPRDSSGSCLLYAVSPAYKTSPVAALNPDSYGQFRIVDGSGATVQGVLPEDRPVAVIFAPEPTLPGQTRENNSGITCGSYYGNNTSNLTAAYLDYDGTTNNAAINTGVSIQRFVAAYAGSDEASNPLNDRLITISHREFWDAMKSTITSSAFDTRMRNLTEAIALCFAKYGDKNSDHLPMPAVRNLNGGEYRRSADYNDSGNFNQAFAGRLPYIVSMANARLANGNNNKIFSNAYCDALDLPSTTTIAEAINFGDDAASDSGSDQGEYFDLWSNWKDHFFYAVSKDFNPDSAASGCSGDCVRVKGIEYAAIVFFSGSKLAGQPRYAPPFEADNKANVANYLENNNAAKFPDNGGDANYNGVTGSSNDIMFCIKPDMSVVPCM